MCVYPYENSLHWLWVKLGEQMYQTCDRRFKVVQKVCQAPMTGIDWLENSVFRKLGPVDDVCHIDYGFEKYML